MPESERLLDEAEVKEIRGHYERQLAAQRKLLSRSEEKAKSVPGLERELERIKKQRDAAVSERDEARADHKRVGRQAVELEIERVDFDNQIAAAQGDVERAVQAQRAAEETSDAYLVERDWAKDEVKKLRDQLDLVNARVDELNELEELERRHIQIRDQKRQKLGL
jgi:soluble lytic murein transglycosylase-like protein